jgi:hypothetical protein
MWEPGYADVAYVEGTVCDQVTGTCDYGLLFDMVYIFDDQYDYFQIVIAKN